MRRMLLSLNLMFLLLVFVRCTQEQQKQEQVNAQSLYAQGYQLYMQAKWKEAIEHFDKTLMIDSTHLSARERKF